MDSATIYRVWDRLANVIASELRSLDNETLLFLAKDEVAEVNGLVATMAQEILAEREVAYH